MSLFKKLMGELVDIVEAPDASREMLVTRFERWQNEIKYGAKLIVREGQAAVFVEQGRLADVFEPGTYTLQTEAIPVLSTLRGWKHGFNSPFKAEVYFVATRQFTDLKWGTMNPVMMRDAEFGMVRVRAYGTYAIRCADPGKLIQELVGASPAFTIDAITEQLRNFIVSRFSEVVAESKIPALDLAANYSEFATLLRKDVQGNLGSYGLEVTSLLVENVSLPPEVEKAMDRRTSMGVVGNLGAYTQFQAAEAMREAASSGGAAGQMAGMGVGFMMANQLGQATGAAQQGVPPPMPVAASFYAAIGGQQVGPMDLATLARRAAAGELTRETLVWTQGMAQWAPAGTVTSLAGLFPAIAATPPPLPGAGGPPPIPR